MEWELSDCREIIRGFTVAPDCREVIRGFTVAPDHTCLVPWWVGLVPG